LPTFVSRRFVDCSDGTVGLAVLHDGLLEYEVLTNDDNQRGVELALTLLRTTGYLSRSQIALRPNPAGPLDPLEGPQLQGRHAVEYALLPHEGTWRDAALYEAADEFLVPLERARVPGGGSTPPSGQALSVEGAQVSAVRREAGALIVRVLNASPEPTVARIALGERAAAGDVIDLRGRVTDSFDGSLELLPWELATLRITT
ncbi:MAG: alpha-mannosidase, partial [Acidimicrobiia bacterium]|nr:alpha-mannosidase [Acidimicrobiia bacterium]